MSFLLLSLLFAAPVAPSVAVNDLTRVNVSPELAAFAAEHVGQALSEHGLKVITAGDIAATLGLERQRQLLGCSGEGSCVAEIGQALGVGYMLTGTLARLGMLYQANLKLIDARDGTPRASWSGSTRDEAQLPALLSRAAASLAEALVPAEPRAARGGPAFWVPLGAGLALGAAGGVCLGLREAAYASLQAPASEGVLSASAAQAARDRGKATQLAAPILGGVGLAAVITAIVVRFAPGGPQVAASVGPEGASLLYTGSF